MDARLLKMAMALKASREKTAQAAEEVEEKREAKAAEKAAAPPRTRVRAPVMLITPTGEREPNSTDVHGWFVEGIHAALGADIRVGSWAAKQRALAKRLLTEYGADMTRKAVAHFCASWKAYLEKGRFKGLPTIELMWSMRDTIFGEIQLAGRKGIRTRQERVQGDEFKAAAADTVPDVGWE